MIANLPDGLRHLRNFAKKRREDGLLAEISTFGGKLPSDYTAVT